MKVDVKVEGFEKLMVSMRDLRRSRVGKVRINLFIGYSAPYALYIHENMEMPHPRGGQAKFLEQVLRENENVTVTRMLELVRRDHTLDEAMIVEGQRLLMLSQALVPVLTGRLRDSGFVEIRQ